jgi:T4 RnlA family RNA ligase
MFVYNLFDSDFTNPIVKECRGIVLEIVNDKVVGVVNYAMDKFFNYGDSNCDKIDWSTAKVQEKLDGQLIRVSRYKGELIWCTNGAFGLNTPLDYTDDKIKNYKELVESSLINDWVNNIPEGWTVFLELTSPYNRIICSYDKIKMWLLGARDNNLKEVKRETVKELFNCPLDTPQVYDLHDIDSTLKMLETFNGKEQEGVVVCDDNFNRIKIKSDDYLRIKYFLGENCITNDKIFESVIKDETDDLLEFDSNLEDKINSVKEELVLFKKLINEYHTKAINLLNSCENRKEYALKVLQTKQNNLWLLVHKI